VLGYDWTPRLVVKLVLVATGLFYAIVVLWVLR